MSFTDTDEENLINLVRPSPVIYDVNHEDYRNNFKKENAWRKIGAELGKSSEDCKKKWKFIRDGYKRYTKKHRLGKAFKSAKGKRHQQLAFLENYPERKSRTLPQNVENDDDSDNEEISLDQQERGEQHNNDEEDAESDDDNPLIPTCEIQSTSKKRLKPINEDTPVQRRKQRDIFRQTLLKTIVKRQNDDVEHFCRHMAQVLRKLPPIQRAEAKQSLNSVLSQYEIMAAKYEAGETAYAEIPESSLVLE